jgi:hypothetical protein
MNSEKKIRNDCFSFIIFLTQKLNGFNEQYINFFLNQTPTDYILNKMQAQPHSQTACNTASVP